MTEISCGTSHCLALCSDGYVYGWGDNRYGQIGCVYDHNETVPQLTRLRNLFPFTIKHIYCSFDQSFALTNGGLVYSWGYNERRVLGCDNNEYGCVSEPTIIKIENIISVCSTSLNTYFLNNDGELYLCGIFIDENNSESIQKIPIKFNIEKISSINSTIIYSKSEVITTATTKENIFILTGNYLERNASKSSFQFHFDRNKVTHKTIVMDEFIYKSKYINKSFANISDGNQRDGEPNNGDEKHEIVVKIFDKIFEKYSLTLKEFIDNFERPDFDLKVEEIKQDIKAFHIFDYEKGYNVLFITSDDKVFGFGSNCFGCCGLGHNSVVNEPQIIPELCHKNIKQFYIGYNFILAQSFNNHSYGWGMDHRGQLGRGYISDETVYLKPLIIESDHLFIEISSGSQHCLAICSNGYVYGWGDNAWGQIGCGKDKGPIITKVIRIEKFSRNSVKHIYCSFGRSFALTFDGLVYSWGRNDWCCLGHELNRNECVFEPKLIIISQVISVGFSTKRTYFLTSLGDLYFCV